MVARPAKLAASATGPYGASSISGWCSGPPAATTIRNLSARGSCWPAIRVGSVPKLVAKLSYSAWPVNAAPVPASSGAGGTAGRGALTSPNTVRPAAWRSSSSRYWTCSRREVSVAECMASCKARIDSFT
eukprot:3084047-Alexandrium_andersonii.AAC.1